MASRVRFGLQNGQCVKVTEALTPEGAWIVRRVEHCEGGAQSMGSGLGEGTPVQVTETTGRMDVSAFAAPTTKVRNAPITMDIIPSRALSVVEYTEGTEPSEGCTTCSASPLKAVASVVVAFVVLTALAYGVMKITE